MDKLTLDTGLLIAAIDQKPGFEDVLKICQWHSDKRVEAFVSSRLFHPDSVKMEPSQREEIRNFLHRFGIQIQGNVCRWNVSPLSGSDKLGGVGTTRSKEELQIFRSVVGDDPMQLPQSAIGNRLSNKIGDYDSLFEHFCAKGDVFLTLDKRDYFHRAKLQEYRDKLGLVIMGPDEYLRNNQQFCK